MAAEIGSSSRTCADAIVETLLAHRLDTIYCLPGFQNDWFFNALHDAEPAVRVVHTRHEQGAAYMALGAALATGRTSLYSVVPGPGVLNTTAALATAYSTNAPVLCLTGQIRSDAIGREFGLLHEIPDQLGILARLTKRAERAATAGEAPSLLARAVRDTTAGRPRPIALEIPPDILATRGDFAPHAPLDPAPAPEPDAGAIAEAARLIAGARAPLIVAGGGALGASAAVRRLAELIQAPVCAYRMGRGTLDERHPLSLNLPGGHRYWKECDVVIGIGARLQMPVQQWGTDPGMRFVRIDIDPHQLGLIRQADIGIVGDAGPVVARLVDELERLAPAVSDRLDRLAAIKAEAATDIAYLKPQLGFLAAIREALGEEGIFVDELTQVGYVSRFAYPVYHPRTYISAGYQGTLGWGYATALGVQHARPDVPVVSVSGDGGFLFNVQEMATAVRHGIPVVAVVFNDGAYGNVRRMQQELYGNRVIATDLTNPDFVALAESFGVAGYRAETPASLAMVLKEAFRRRAPALVEVPVGELPDPFRILTTSRIRGQTP